MTGQAYQHHHKSLIIRKISHPLREVDKFIHAENAKLTTKKNRKAISVIFYAESN